MASRAVLIRLDDSMLEKVDEAASTDGVSRAEWVRRACTRALDDPKDVGDAEMAGLRERVAGMEALVASHRERLADSQAHSLDLKSELDNVHRQHDGLTALLNAMREQNDTLVRALPPGPSERRGGWRSWFSFGRVA